MNKPDPQPTSPTDLHSRPAEPAAGYDAGQLRARAMAALRRGEFDLAEQAIARGDATLAELVENLRIYQVELQMQAEELQRSQARTQQALDRFTLLFARLPVPALLIDANGVVIESNARAEATFGLSATMMRGYLFHRLVDADDYQAEVRGALLDARSAGQAEVAAVRFRARADSQIVGDLHVESLADPVSGAQQFACVMVDRTEQIAQLEQLQSTVARLSAHGDERSRVGGGEAMPVCLLTDATGVVLWSDAALGVPPGAVLGAHVEDARLLAAALADGAPVEVMLPEAGGTRQRVMLRPVRDANGVLRQYAGSGVES